MYGTKSLKLRLYVTQRVIINLVLTVLSSDIDLGLTEALRNEISRVVRLQCISRDVRLQCIFCFTVELNLGKFCEFSSEFVISFSEGKVG